MNRAELRKHLSETKKLVKTALAEDIPGTLEMLASAFSQHANHKKSVRLTQTSQNGGWGDEIVAGHYVAALLLCINIRTTTVAQFEVPCGGDQFHVVQLGLPTMEPENNQVVFSSVVPPPLAQPGTATPDQDDDEDEDLDEGEEDWDEDEDEEDWGDEDEDEEENDSAVPPPP